MTASTAPRLSSQTKLWTAAMPFVFVVLWSSGFVVAKMGLPYAPPFTFLVLRFAGVLAFLVPVALLARVPWPVGQIRYLAIAGVLVQAGYLSGVWTAMKLGMPAGLSALIVGMQPVLTALAARFVGEKVRGRQWIGLLFGLGGVALVVANKITLIGLSWQSIGFCVMGLLSITTGTLFQKRHCPHFDLRAGAIIQYAAALAVMVPVAMSFEEWTPAFAHVQWCPQFIGSLLWSILALSIGAVFLLFSLIRKSAATAVTSLLYLTPPTTALMAWALFGEKFSLIGLAGMGLAVIGVTFVVRAPRG